MNHEIALRILCVVAISAWGLNVAAGEELAPAAHPRSESAARASAQSHAGNVPIMPSAKLTMPEPVLFTAEAIARETEHALRQTQSRLSRGVLVHRIRNGEAQQWRMALTRGVADGDERTLVVFDTGAAILTGTRPDRNEAFEAIYLPAEGRARELTPVFPEDAFLGTDLTKRDIGIADPGTATFKLLGTEDIGNRMAYKLEEEPGDRSEFSRIVTWVAADDWMPVEREYYDRANRLWKVANYRDMIIDGEPALMRLTMKDVQSGSETDYVVHRIEDHPAGGENLFRTSRLAETSKQLSRAHVAGLAANG